MRGGLKTSGAARRAGPRPPARPARTPAARPARRRPAVCRATSPTRFRVTCTSPSPPPARRRRRRAGRRCFSAARASTVRRGVAHRAGRRCGDYATGHEPMDYATTGRSGDRAGRHQPLRGRSVVHRGRHSGRRPDRGREPAPRHDSAQRRSMVRYQPRLIVRLGHSPEDEGDIEDWPPAQRA